MKDEQRSSVQDVSESFEVPLLVISKAKIDCAGGHVCIVDKVGCCGRKCKITLRFYTPAEAHGTWKKAGWGKKSEQCDRD